MYTIVMQDDKTLVATITTTIYQKEKLADKIQFLFPEQYSSLNLGECDAVLKYVDPANVPHSEILSKDEALYKNKLRYTLPVDTALTKFAGDIELRITFSKFDAESNKQYVMHTGVITIPVTPLKDYYEYLPDESLEIIDQLIGNLEAKIKATETIAETYNKKKADNITYEEDKLQLTSNGEKIGNAITIISGDSPSPGGVTELEIVEL